MSKYTEKTMQYIVARLLNKERIPCIPNVRMKYKGTYEADLLYINNNNYMTEVEIKVSYSDFLADFKKKVYHNHPHIKYFYYAMPHEIFSNHRALILDYLGDNGLITVYDRGEKVKNRYVLQTIKKAKARKCIQLTTQDVLKYYRLGCFRWSAKRYELD